jgi:hypothetical protein
MTFSHAKYLKYFMGDEHKFVGVISEKSHHENVLNVKSTE